MQTSPKILAFEAATQACSAALCIGSTIIERFQVAPRKHSDLILPMIDEMLKEAGVTLDQVDAIAVGIGPGSFMGVRLAVGIAQSLAFGQDKRVIPVSTLQILAQTAHRELKMDQVLAAWDARMGEMYGGAYQLKNHLMQPMQKDQLTAPEKFKLLRGGWEIAGNAWQVYIDQFSNEVQEFLQSKNLKTAFIYPKAQDLLTIAKEKFEQDEFVSVNKLEPMYLRNDVAKIP